MPQSRFDRRLFLRATAATGAAATVGGLSAPSASAAPGGFPDYTYVRTLLTPSQLKYNPTGEIIFPCVRGVYDKLSAPLGRYYLYYGPHNAPGGICLAYGDSWKGLSRNTRTTRSSPTIGSPTTPSATSRPRT